MGNREPLSKILRKASLELDLPIDFITGGARVTIYGNREIILENHKGILDYGPDLIKINCGDLILKVTGLNLALSALNTTEMRIVGEIITLEYLT